MTDSNDWLQLATTWQAQAIDLPTLQRSTRWHTLRLYALIGVEIAVVLMVWALAIYWQWFKPLPTLWQLWGWLWAVLAPLLTWFNLRARTGSFRASEDSVRGLLELKKARAEGSLRTIRFGNAVLPYAIALAWLWNLLAVWLYPPKVVGVAAFSGGLLVTVTLLLWLALCRRRAKRERRIIAEVEQWLQELR